MINYQNFDTKDFIEDISFKNWVMNPTAQSDDFWQGFLEQFPQKKQTVAEAKNILLATKLEVELHFHSEEKVQQIFENIRQEIQTPEPVSVIRLGLWQWAAAASVLLMVGLGFWYFKLNDNQNTDSVYAKNLAQNPKANIEQENTSDAPMMVKLPDGSKVTLEKNSKFSYPKAFDKEKREVYLTGEAFFQVTKDPNRPFLVYANELITKVLGTSFSIKAYEEDKNVTVSVKTGRVSVFGNKPKQTKDPETTGLVLTPNQQVVFTREDQRLSRTLIANPTIIVSTEQLQQYVFEDAPATQIFEAIKKAYGVDIVFDEEMLKECRLTTSLTNETLYQKLDIICKGIDAEYKVVDAEVIITSKGCR